MSGPTPPDFERTLAAFEQRMQVMEANMEKIMVAQRAVIAISLRIAARLGTEIVESDDTLGQSDLDRLLGKKPSAPGA